ncbi:hypothetical protein GCM10020254_28400 [Streptomyces goshikiensis]
MIVPDAVAAAVEVGVIAGRVAPATSPAPIPTKPLRLIGVTGCSPPTRVPRWHNDGKGGRSRPKGLPPRGKKTVNIRLAGFSW